MSGKKHNQFRERITRQHGHADMDFADKKRVRNHLGKRGFKVVITDGYLGIRHDDSYFAFTKCTKAFASQFSKIRHPDIMAWKDPTDDPIIVEIDGAVHADLDTDDDYEAIGIKYTKLNKAYLAAEEESWENAIDICLAKWGFI